LSQQAQQAEGCSEAVDESPAEPLDVADLTRRMAEGDESAYRVFYDAYFNRLSRYLLVVTGGDEEAAREALQATLVRVVRHIKVFSDEAVFWSWLTVLARSALSDQGRKRRRYLAFLDRFTLHTRVQQPGPGASQAEDRLLGLLDGGLEGLPFDERDLVERKYFARQSVREIAETLETTEKAVESRLVRIRRKLKATVLDKLKDEPAQ
jgi:RNA polymerase sigma-70 factor, ECF subfamily